MYFEKTAKYLYLNNSTVANIYIFFILIFSSSFIWLFFGTSVTASEIITEKSDATPRYAKRYHKGTRPRMGIIYPLGRHKTFMPFRVQGNAHQDSDRERETELNREILQLKSYSEPTQFTGVETIQNSTLENNYRNSTTEISNGLNQITNVNQLKDVSPTDWAYEALRSLVDRYSDARSLAPDGDAGSHRCILGFPNQTYRGSQPLSRYEFAAGLNSCLNQIERLISSESVGSEDLSTIQRLNQEFAAELATIKTQLDSVETRTAVLEDNQFSTTTKLNGLVWFNITGAAADGDVLVETSDLSAPAVIRPPGRDPVTGEPTVQEITDNPEITFSDLVWLTFESSFTGKDVLTTRLAVGNGDSPANVFASAGAYNTFGIPFTDQTAGVQGEGNSEVVIHDLSYNFPVGNKFRFVIGPQINWYAYFDQNAYTFFLTGASSFNSIGSSLSNAIDRGSGAVVLWDISDKFKLNVGYLGESTEFLPSPPFNTASDPDEGVFGGTNTSTAELTFSPTETVNTRLMYNYTHLSSDVNVVGGVIGGVTGEPLQNGLADAGPGAGLDVNPDDGGLNDSYSHTLGFNFDWAIANKFGIFARYTYASITLQPIDDTVNVQSIQAGFAFPDVGKEGALVD